jgi:hypothetical protein
LLLLILISHIPLWFLPSLQVAVAAEWVGPAAAGLVVEEWAKAAAVWEWAWVWEALALAVVWAWAWAWGPAVEWEWAWVWVELAVVWACLEAGTAAWAG